MESKQCRQQRPLLRVKCEMILEVTRDAGEYAMGCGLGVSDGWGGAGAADGPSALLPTGAGQRHERLISARTRPRSEHRGIEAPEG